MGTIFIFVVLAMTVHLCFQLIWDIISAIADKFTLTKPHTLPLRMWDTNEVVYTEKDWHRDNRRDYPVRYWITRVFGPMLTEKRSRTYNA
jgi:hypothetical protein